MPGPYVWPPMHKYNGDAHGYCLVCGEGKDGTHHLDDVKLWFDVNSTSPNNVVMYNEETGSFDEYEIASEVMYPKEPLPDRILGWLAAIFDAIADFFGAIFDTTVGKWLAIVGIVAFILFLIFCAYMFVVLVIGTFIVGWDVCASGVLPWDIVYTDGGCS